MILYVIVINPLATGVENECWLREWNKKCAAYNLPNVIWLGLGQVESYLIQKFYEKVKNDRSKVRTRTQCRTGAYNVFAACATLTLMKCSIYFYNNCEKNLMTLYGRTYSSVFFLNKHRTVNFVLKNMCYCCVSTFYSYYT